MKTVYYITMSVLLICILSNAYCLLILKHTTIPLKVIDIITPAVVLFYLAFIIHRRRTDPKKRNEEIDRHFSKN
ncbi:ABC-type uncharacterized transport system permease subunit [Sphingobacterium sp. HSC-15S19]|uniref:hypothetical protein n=1 Tax=Sphingobacterium siyangense TaxID=459529 RepID=UPI00268BA211